MRKSLTVSAVVLITAVVMLTATALGTSFATPTTERNYEILLTVTRVTDLSGGIGTYFSVTFSDGILSSGSGTSGGTSSGGGTVTMSANIGLAAGDSGKNAEADSRITEFYTPLVKKLTEKYGSLLSSSYNRSGVQIGLYFEDYREYYKAHGIDGFTYDGDDDGTETEKGFFYNAYVTHTKTLFSGDYSESYLVTDFLTPIAEFAESFGKTVDKEYVYGTKYTRAITSDADYYEEINGVRYHHFVITDAEREITLRQSSPNTAVFYSVIVAAGLVVAGVTIAAIIIKRKKEKGNA